MSQIPHDQNAIVKELEPAEAAHLLDQLERGYQAAYTAAREAYGTSDHLPRRAMADDLDQLSQDEHWATFATGMRQPGESISRFQHRAETEAARQQMTCPECGEHAQNQVPAELVNWQAHGLEQPEWSHRDGSSLCPVPGPSGGYQPAQPQPAWPVPERDNNAADVARLDPPAALRPGGWDIRQAAVREAATRDHPDRPHGTIPRQYLADTIRHLDVGQRPEREAGG